VQISNRTFLLSVVLATCVGCDQATKKLAVVVLKDTPPRIYLGNLLRLEYAENPGAFLGLGGALPDWHRFALLTLVSSAILVGLALFVCLKRSLSATDVVGYALILAGGASNMIDRVAAGVVVDFLNVGIGPLRTGIFNVADMAIMAGLATVLLAHARHIVQATAPAHDSAPGP
jgi:signal peptidase II